MPQITLDGQLIEAAAGKTIIEAALENGVNIPHFCWHPALSVAGNCRMCLVRVGSQKKDATGAFVFDAEGKPEVSWIPKMQIACATPVADGMVIDTKSKLTESSQNNVMEFLLINHPLDCPICDEAGQCKLQEYAFTHSRGKSRFDEEKVHKPKRVSLSDDIIFDGERCISCSRCIRFAEEVAEQPVLTFVQRGDKVTIETFPGTKFDSPLSMNVIDICPVGALTSVDFRFKARVWEMSWTDSISPLNGKGDNIKLGVMNNEVLRVDPRTNMHVNTYWIENDVRLNTPGIVNDNRVVSPRIKRMGKQEDVSWDIALTAAADALRNAKPSHVMVLGSAQSSNEDTFVLGKFVRDILKTSNFDFIHQPGKAPNTVGAVALGMKPADGGHGLDQLLSRMTRGDVKVLVVLEDSLEAYSNELAAAMASVDTVIVLTSHNNATAQAATIVFPTSTFAETTGTFTNDNSRVQKFEAAIVTAENERYMGMKMSRWDRFGQWNDRWTKGSRRDVRPAWRILTSLAHNLGATTNWQYANSEAVFNDLAHRVDGFKHMTYELLDAYQGLVLGKADKPSQQGVVYESHEMKPN